MNSGRKDALKKRLDENYAAFIESLQGKTAPELIAMAPAITAAQQLCKELLDVCDEEEAAFLLRFDDPLEIVRGYWESEVIGYDHRNEMGHMLWKVQKDIEDDMELQEKTPEKNCTVRKTGGVSVSDNTVKQITTDDLRHMEDKEGLILQGCGGPLQEWVDGINDLFTEAGILLAGSRFENVSSFRHDGVTCLLFPFGDVKLDIGRLALWRIQTYEQFGGTWLSDFVPNLLGGFIIREYGETKSSPKPKSQKSQKRKVRNAHER